jgi:hypothetical protein
MFNINTRISSRLQKLCIGQRQERTNLNGERGKDISILGGGDYMCN